MEYKEGDIFFWAYKDDYLESVNDGNNGGTTYWCKSRIFIFKNGRLQDTYWGNHNPYIYTLDYAEKNMSLVYKGNIKDYRKISPHEEVYFEPEDILNLNHANSPSGNLYVKTSAKRSERKMREIIQYNIDKLIREKDYIEGKIKRFQDSIDNFDINMSLWKED